MSAELLRDPENLSPNGPPPWLRELARANREADARPDDGRLDVLSERVVDEVLAGGVSAGQLIAWLEARHQPTHRRRRSDRGRHGE